MKGFRNLDLYYKRNLLKEHAIHVLTTEVVSFTIQLYTWDRFFIEQYFDRVSQEITRISIADEDDLIKHLNRIGISDLGFRLIL